MTTTDSPKAEQPEFDLTALGRRATTRTETKLKEDTDASVGNAAMHLSNLLKRLSGKSRLGFAQMFEALLEEAAESNDPEAFMSDLLNDSTPVDRNSVAHDLRDELTLLDAQRDDQSHEVGATIALIKKMVNHTFGPEADTVGTPQPWRVIHHPSLGSMPAIVVALKESNDRLLSALDQADEMGRLVVALRDMKFDAHKQPRPYNHEELLLHVDDQNTATAVLTDYQQAAEAARRAVPAASRQQGSLGSGNNS